MPTRETNELERSISDEIRLNSGNGDHGRFLEPLIILAKHKRRVGLIVLAALVASVALVLLLPNYYTGEAKLLPPQQSQSFAAAMLDQLGSLGPILGAAGGRDLLRNPNELYIAMLKSRRVADDLIDQFSLMSVYREKLREDARKKLSVLTEIASGKDGVITISVDDRDPKRAAAIANAYVVELEKLTKTLAVTDASKRRVFYEREAKAASDQLADAEQALKKTEETTGIIQLDSQAKVMLEGYAELRARATAQEVEIEAMRTFATPQNPDLIRAGQQLRALRAEIARYEQGQGGSAIGDPALEKVPAKALEYIRRLREVRYRETLVTLLLRQYEVARIDEGKEASLIQSLDMAVTPERKSSPHRALICISVMLLAFIFSWLWYYFREALDRAKDDAQFAARLQMLKFYAAWRKKEKMRVSELRT